MLAHPGRVRSIPEGLRGEETLRVYAEIRHRRKSLKAGINQTVPPGSA